MSSIAKRPFSEPKLEPKLEPVTTPEPDEPVIMKPSKEFLSSLEDITKRIIPEKPDKTLKDYDYDELLKLKPEELFNMCIWDIQTRKNSRRMLIRVDSNKMHILHVYRSITIFKCDKAKHITVKLRNECDSYKNKI